MSQGRSLEDAQRNLAEAVELYVESFGVDDLPKADNAVVFYPLEVAASLHDELAVGTLLGILKQCGLSREELLALME